MLPFSQTDLSFVDSLTIHPSQQKTQQQSQHFVTSSTLHPGSALSVVEASEATGKLMFEFFHYEIGTFDSVYLISRMPPKVSEEIVKIATREQYDFKDCNHNEYCTMKTKQKWVHN